MSAFIPLVNLTSSNSPTTFFIGSHPVFSNAQAGKSKHFVFRNCPCCSWLSVFPPAMRSAFATLFPAFEFDLACVHSLFLLILRVSSGALALFVVHPLRRLVLLF